MSVNSNSTRVVTGEVRLSYANIFEPKSINGSKPKYSISLIIPKSDTATIGKIEARSTPPSKRVSASSVASARTRPL